MTMYEHAVPLSRTRHAAWHLERKGYEFCREVSSVPLVTAEFAAAALEYPVVFHEAADQVMPVAVLGIRPGQNLYLARQGDWQARYIPAFVRRYPFVFASNDNNTTFTLCIDEMFDGFNQAGRGERLFDGLEPSPYISNMLKFLQRYHAEFQRTRDFCKKLKDMNLTQPMQAQLSLESGQKMALAGFSVVDRGRLKTLSKEAVSKLMESDELELIFAHLASLQTFTVLRDRLGNTGPD
jgi:hypothetical protein